MGLDPVGGDCGDMCDALAGESGKAAHGVEDGAGNVGGLGASPGSPPRPRALAPARSFRPSAPEARGERRAGFRPPRAPEHARVWAAANARASASHVCRSPSVDGA
jgi:hypothetical protein